MLDPNTDPNYFTIVVGVENADSCGYISTCTMELTVTMSGTGDGMISDIGGGGVCDSSLQVSPITKKTVVGSLSSSTTQTNMVSYKE